MKKLNFIIVLLISCRLLFAQYAQDISLEKPIVNFNEPNGGFYSEYSDVDLDSLYLSAIVKNVGTTDATNVYLEISLFDYSESLINTYYSESISLLAVGQTDTIDVLGIVSELTQYTKLLFSIKSDFIDENASNNVDTLPAIMLYYGDWNNVSRSISLNDSINIREIEGFQSGDFLGIRVKRYYQHSIHSVGLPCFNVLPNDITANAVVYQNESLIIEASANLDQAFIYATIDQWTDLDTEYVYGFEFTFDNDDDLYIKVDTSNCHNFVFETVASIGGEWTSLNFVPAIQLICDPENVQNIGQKSDINVYPNPTADYLFIESNSEIVSVQVLSAEGVKVINVESDMPNEMIDLKRLASGVYVLRIETQEAVFTRKITKL
jgi:hypothetical protein